MGQIRDVIAKDITTVGKTLATVGKMVGNTIEPVVFGFGRGAYTPFLVSTSLHNTGKDFSYAYEQFNERFEKPYKCLKEPVKMLIHSCSLGFGAVVVQAPLAMVAYGENLGKEYLAVLAITNFVDYVWNVGRRSVEKK